MSDNKKTNLPAIQGSGGGGGKGGGGAPSEVRDNQFSNVIAKVLVAYSSGQTDGLIGGSDGIFLDQTQLTGNFQGVSWQERYGTAGQSSIPGFERANSVVNVGVEMDANNPVIRTVTDSEVDAVRVIITIPALQYVESDGDIKDTSIDLELSVKDPSSGVWEERGTPTITGKSSGPFQRQYTIRGPDNITGAWDWRVTRITPNSTSSRLSNDSTVQAVNEIRYGKETYDDTAYVALEFDTQDFGNNIPALAFRVSGNRVRVPSNYTDDGTPSYSGVWDGTWTYSSTENPVWHIYHLLTDNEIGLGLDESFIDRYNFYESARYCDAVDNFGNFVGVPDGNGGVRRRFTLNTQITGQKDGLEMLQDIASSMRAVLYFGAGAVVLKQDMPRNVARIVTNENVKDGTFFYSSTPAKDRITVAKVGYNDPDDFFNIKYARYPSSSDWNTDPNIQRYGRNEIEVTKLGCTSEAEAYTFAKWIVYSSCNETRTVTFTGSPEFMLTRPGDILEIADRRLAGASSFDQRYGGRIAGGTTTSVILDYEVELSGGEDYTITIIAADGVTMETRNITTGAGTVTEVDVDAAFSDVPTVGYTWLIQGTDIVPQKYSVIHTERGEGLEVEVFAIQHDDQKFAAVEEGTVIIPKPYTRLDVTNIAAPTNLQYQVVPRIDDALGVLNSLIVKWDASTSGFATSYRVRYRLQGGAWQDDRVQAVNEITIDNVTNNTYEILVYAQSPLGYESVPLSGSYTVVYGGNQFEWEGQAIQIESPTITSGTTFNGKDLEVKWDRSPLNDRPGIVFKEYVVEFVVNNTIMRTITTTDTRTTYYFDDMVVDQGTDYPSRTIEVRVRERDALLHESISAITTVTNPTPNVPTFKITTGFNHSSIDITPVTDTDIKGYYVFRGTTSTFSADVNSMIHKGSDTSITDTGLEEDTVYYYKVAAYDVFDDSIANLNVSSALSGETKTVKGLLVDYTFKDIKFTLSGNTVNWTAGSYVKTVGDTVTTGTTTAGSVVWSSGTVYVYFDDITGDIATSTDLVAVYTGSSQRRVLASYDGNTIKEGVNEPIMDGANILAQTVGATQVVSSGLITNTAQINNGIIENAHIKDATIEDAKIISVDAGKITTGTLLASETITSEGVIRSINGTNETGLGNKNIGGTDYQLWATKDGNLQLGVDTAGNATYSGALNAASGTFAGSLSAADGTFTGSLSAADGTFTGSLSAADGTFAGTLTLAQIDANKVTIKSAMNNGYSKSVAVISSKFDSSNGSAISSFALGGFHMPGSTNATSTTPNWISTTNGVHIIFTGSISFAFATWGMEYRRTYSDGTVQNWTKVNDAPELYLDSRQGFQVFQPWSFGVDLYAIATEWDRYIEFRMRRFAVNHSSQRVYSIRSSAWYSNL